MGLINWFKHAMCGHIRSTKVILESTPPIRMYKCPDCGFLDTEGNAEIVYVRLISLDRIGYEDVLYCDKPSDLYRIPVLVPCGKLDRRGNMGYIEIGAVKL